MWKEMMTHIRKVTIEVFRVTRGKINVNLKTLSDGMMMYKKLSMRRKNVTNIYITT
jgi:phage portal protein BeeE